MSRQTRVNDPSLCVFVDNLRLVLGLEPIYNKPPKYVPVGRTEAVRFKGFGGLGTLPGRATGRANVDY